MTTKLTEFVSFRKQCGDSDYEIVARIRANNIDAKGGRNRSWQIASDEEVNGLALAYTLRGDAIQ